MKRLSLASLVVLGLVLALTPVMSAYAVKLPAYVKFEGYALGRCLLFYQSVPAEPGEGPIWYGLASGSIALKGFAKATSYQELPGWTADYFQIYGMAYFTAPEGYVDALGFLAVTWIENSEPHQLWITIYSKPTSQGIFQPKTDKFVAGIPPVLEEYPPPEPLLSYKGIYKNGSNLQYLSSSITVWTSKAEQQHPLTGTEFMVVGLGFGDYGMNIVWFSETATIYFGPDATITVPAATTIERDVKLL